MNTNLEKLLQKEMSRKDFLSFVFLLFISCFGVYGVLHELLSHAAGPYTSAEAEKGTLGGSASTTNSSSDSAGSAVQFGPPPTAPGSFLPNVPAGTVVPTTLIFDDEFNKVFTNASGTGLNPASWDTSFFTSGNNVSWIPSNVSVVPAQGAIISLSSSGVGGGFSTTNEFMLSPSAGQVFIEYSAAMAGANGSAYGWPAVWATAINGHWPGDGEIDLMEGFGNLQQHAIVAGDTAPVITSEAYTPGQHIFGCLWTGSHTSFFVDGKLLGSGAANQPGPMALVVNMGNNGNTPSFPASMVVRYCRVWGVPGNVVAPNF